MRRLCLILVALLLANVPDAALAKRVALVVANSQYSNATVLKNPVGDGRLIAAALARAGFDSVTLKIDLGKTALEAELQAFSARAQGADVALIYYAGHGIEAGGQNYLIPTDAKLARDRDLEIEATRLDTALLMGEGARLRIVVLDACRNNPFIAGMARTLKTRAVGRGLAAVEPEGETLVVYAAKAGATAADGEGANSPFAEAMAKRLPQPGLEISLLFRAVRDDVLRATGREQEPFTYGSLSGEAFFFVPGASGAQVTKGGRPTIAPTVSSETAEALFWQGAVSANSARAYRDYLGRYPRGTYAGLANENIKRLTAPPPRPVTAPPGYALALPTLGNAFAAPPPQAGAAAGDTVARYAFTPSRTIRAKAQADFIAQLKSNQPQIGAMMELAFGMQDIFATADKELVKYGYSTSNLADAFALMIDTLRDCANGKTGKDVTRTQAQALRQQLAAVLAVTPATANLTDAQKQQYSDTMILNASFLAFALESAEKGDPAQLRAFSDEVARTAKTTYGLDLRAIRLTDEGYKFN